VNPERWQRIKELFGSALEQEHGERSAFLRKACGQDDELRTELESLLASFDSNKSTAGGSAPSASPTHSVAAAGQNIGRYRIIRQIGSGGMGAVYLAVRADDEFNKRVAIKLVQAGIDTQQILNRFRHERQILAALDHPNIAKLLDGGTTAQGLPYFVMDFVEGTRIDEYCDSHRLSVLERVRLFREVCSAAQYVHQNLVVHRDNPYNFAVVLFIHVGNERSINLDSIDREAAQIIQRRISSSKVVNAQTHSQDFQLGQDVLGFTLVTNRHILRDLEV
jgi:eukaryotic-like serine/threonine-protein kinase